MRRREVVALLLSTLISFLLVGIAHAQPTKKVWRIGYLSGQFGQTELSRSVVRGLRTLVASKDRTSLSSTALPWAGTSG